MPFTKPFLYKWFILMDFFLRDTRGPVPGGWSHILVSYRNIYTLIERDRTIPRRSGMGERT